MQSKVERFANEAVFVLQFNSAEAVRYIQRNAGVDEKTAKAALKSTVTFHRQPRSEKSCSVTV